MEGGYGASISHNLDFVIIVISKLRQSGNCQLTELGLPTCGTGWQLPTCGTWQLPTCGPTCPMKIHIVYNGFYRLKQARFRNVSEMFQKCFRHASDMFQACVRHVSNMFQTCFRHVSEMFQACFRHVSGMLQTCVRHVSGMFQVCFRRASDMFHSFPDMFQICFRHVAYISDSRVNESVFIRVSDIS